MNTNFQKNGVSYEWESEPDYQRCKKVCLDAVLAYYETLPLDVLKQPSLPSLSASIADTFDKMMAKLKAEHSTFRWLTAKAQGEPVGFLFIDMKKFPEEIYMAEMAVDPQHQRKGIATTFTQCLFEQYPTAGRIVVITRIANKPANALYLALGFSPSPYMSEGYSRELYTGFERVNPSL